MWGPNPMDLRTCPSHAVPAASTAFMISSMGAPRAWHSVSPPLPPKSFIIKVTMASCPTIQYYTWISDDFCIYAYQFNHHLPGPTRTDHPPGSPTSGRTQRATWPWSDLKRGVSSNPCAQRDPTSPGEWYPERQLSELSGVKRPEQFGHLSAWVAGTDILRQLI